MAQLVETLNYKPEGRGFEWSFSLIPSDRSIDLGSTQPLTEMSNRNIS